MPEADRECPRCKGVGGNPSDVCDLCGGSGRVTVRYPDESAHTFGNDERGND